MLEDVVGRQSTGNGGNVQGEAKKEDDMSRLRGGAHNRVYDNTLEEDVQDVAINIL